jgi:hypothetical protein
LSGHTSPRRYIRRHAAMWRVGRRSFRPAVTDREDMPPEYKRLIRAFCRACGWWCIALEKVFYGPHGQHDEWAYAYSILRQYDVSETDVPLREAREYLRRHPDSLARFDPFRFEDLIAGCLRDYFGDGEIVKVGGRQDGGVDVKAFRTSRECTLIQIKRRADFAKSESVRTVRELHGVMLREGVPRGMIITTARRFSRQAEQERSATRKRLKHYSMDFFTLRDVVDLLHLPAHSAQSPWEDLAPADGWEADPVWIERSALPAYRPGKLPELVPLVARDAFSAAWRTMNRA